MEKILRNWNGKDKIRSERPKKVTIRQKRQIRRILFENRKQTINQIRAKYNLFYAGNNKMSRETITKILVDIGLRSQNAC